MTRRIERCWPSTSTPPKKSFLVSIPTLGLYWAILHLQGHPPILSMRMSQWMIEL
ncbi:hypothetical protein O9992_21720 [Vibrio lentus]|nr:hypothetical protein [Vibrio lentus]